MKNTHTLHLAVAMQKIIWQIFTTCLYNPVPEFHQMPIKSYPSFLRDLLQYGNLYLSLHDLMSRYRKSLHVNYNS